MWACPESLSPQSSGCSCEVQTVMQLQYCFVLFLLSLTVLKSSQECTQGFIDYELLSVKAVHIGDSTIDDTVTGIGTKKDNRTYVVPELNFTCSGNITGFLLAIDIRIHGDRDLYPWVALFNRVDSTFTQVPGSQRNIVLGPDDFSTSGLFNYTLSSPIQFTSGNIIGVHQPNFTASVVRLQRQRYGTSTDHIIRINNNGGAITNIDNMHFNYFNSTLLMLPITDNTNCLNSGFISFEDLLMNARLVTTVSQYYGLFNDNNMFFKDIKFTCDGTIRNVIVGMKEYNLSSSILLPEIRIWRLVNNTHYAQSGPTIPLNYSHAEPDLSTGYLRWYNLSVPMKEGDVLGIYHTNVFDSRESVIYHQRYSGPYNYYSSSDIDQVYDYNIYPLISVVFSKFVPSTSSILFSSTSISTSIEFSSVTTPILTSTNTISVITSIASYTTVATATSISMLGSTSFGEVVTSPSAGSDSSISVHVQSGTMSSSLHQTKTSLYSTSTIHPSQVDAEPNGSSIVPIIAGTIVSVAITLAIIAAVTVIILVIAIKQRKKSYIITTQSDGSHLSLSNMMYENNVAAVGDSNGGITNMLYNAVHPINGEALTNPMYQDVSHRKECDHASTFKSDVPSTSKHIELSSINSTTLVPGTQEKETTVNTLTSALYDEWDNKDSMHDDKKIYNTIRSGVCVPTESQRQELSGKGKQENIYAVLYSSISDCGEGFFKEEPLYWDPENSTKGVYEQLAQQRYREIPRHEIRLVSHLGSGQFGTVDKGIWDTPKGPVEVAVKTLSGSITKEDEVKFLQEAAINGQFHHPNVVQLCGVVTVGQPTMIVLEYITHGDLKSFLEARRPNPGELPDVSLAPLLFKFSHQVACGMAYLSRKKFIHRDLAARNILVDNGTVCKIADFGMSRNLQDETYYTSKNKKIPVKWTAPEAIYYRKYSTQSDVWSFGALLYEVWSVGYKPFEQYTNQECIRLTESGYRLPSPSGCPQAVYEIMINCWNPVSSDRPSFDSLQSLLSSNPQSLSSPSDHPLSNLGSSVLLHDQSLYPELQNKYK